MKVRMRVSSLLLSLALLFGAQHSSAQLPPDPYIVCGGTSYAVLLMAGDGDEWQYSIVPNFDSMSSVWRPMGTGAILTDPCFGTPMQSRTVYFRTRTGTQIVGSSSRFIGGLPCFSVGPEVEELQDGIINGTIDLLDPEKYEGDGSEVDLVYPTVTESSSDTVL